MVKYTKVAHRWKLFGPVYIASCMCALLLSLKRRRLVDDSAENRAPRCSDIQVGQFQLWECNPSEPKKSIAF